MRDKIIIGVVGKKQSGKDTLCDFLKLLFYDPNIREKYYKYGLTKCDIYLLEKDVKCFSFADSLKQLCMNVLGLTYQQCNGTNEDKNSLTNFKWENLPTEIRIKDDVKKEGFMTAREILQVVGTDIFRNYFDTETWIKSTMRAIEKDDCSIALISDVRFPEEVDIIDENDGYIFQLTRNVCKTDVHISEKALEGYDFKKKEDHHFFIDNKDMSIEEKNKAVLSVFNKILRKVLRNDTRNGKR